MTGVYERNHKKTNMYLQYSKLPTADTIDSDLLRQYLAHRISTDCVLSLENDIEKMTDSLYYELALQNFLALYNKKGLKNG
jgi:hypothetical protein